MKSDTIFKKLLSFAHQLHFQPQPHQLIIYIISSLRGRNQVIFQQFFDGALYTTY